MKHHSMKILSLLLFGCLACTAQNLLVNGDFEQCKGNNLIGWDQTFSGKQAFYEVDPQIRHSGKYSLRVGPIMKAFIPFVQFGSKIEAFQDDYLVRGWVRYENLQTISEDGIRCALPFIGFWTHGPAGNGFTVPVMGFTAGSKDWTYFEKTVKAEEIRDKYLRVPDGKRPQNISFRINVSNQLGKVWFDDLEIIKVERQVLNVSLSGKELSDVFDIDVFLQARQGTFEDGKTEVSVVLTDEAGKEHGKKNIAINGKKQTVRFDISNLKQGKYTVSVTPLSGFKHKFSPIQNEFRKIAGAFDE